jgi:glycosyltransferase involved in cell wall biosynthesis
MEHYPQLGSQESVKNPLVSVMMPAYNAAAYIKLAIDSLLAQSYPCWELIVIDDGSQDNTPKVLAGYNDPRIKIFHQENNGESSARNAALSRINGELLAFLDADDGFLPGHLESTVAFLGSHQEYDGVYTDGYYINENGERLKFLSSRRRGPFQGDIFDEMVRASDVFGTPICVVLRSSLVHRFGLSFDTDIVIGPDWDFLVRYAEHARFGYLGELTCLYRIHSFNISNRTESQKRRSSLTICREKAIKAKRFGECSLQTRSFVFYDLLVNLLDGEPARQTATTAWPEFRGLPAPEQARLYRLMASRAIGHGQDHHAVRDWLDQARQLNPQDTRSAIVDSLYRLSPGLCKFILHLRSDSRSFPEYASPFSDFN